MDTKVVKVTKEKEKEKEKEKGKGKCVNFSFFKLKLRGRTLISLVCEYAFSFQVLFMGALNKIR